MTWTCPRCRTPIGQHIYVNGRLACPTDTDYPEIEKRSS